MINLNYLNLLAAPFTIFHYFTIVLLLQNESKNYGKHDLLGFIIEEKHSRIDRGWMIFESTEWSENVLA